MCLLACLLSKIYVKQLEMEVGDCVYIANSHKLNLEKFVSLIFIFLNKLENIVEFNFLKISFWWFFMSKVTLKFVWQYFPSPDSLFSDLLHQEFLNAMTSHDANHQNWSFNLPQIKHIKNENVFLSN